MNSDSLRSTCLKKAAEQVKVLAVSNAMSLIQENLASTKKCRKMATGLQRASTSRDFAAPRKTAW